MPWIQAKKVSMENYCITRLKQNFSYPFPIPSSQIRVAVIKVPPFFLKHACGHHWSDTFHLKVGIIFSLQKIYWNKIYSPTVSVHAIVLSQVKHHPGKVATLTSIDMPFKQLYQTSLQGRHLYFVNDAERLALPQWTPLTHLWIPVRLTKQMFTFFPNNKLCGT